MLFSYNWLKEYFEEELPEPSELARLITLHAYEVESVEGKQGDFLLDIDVLPNRSSDSYSHDGIAREISTILGIQLKEKKYKEIATDEISTEDAASLSVENPILVPRATKRLAVDVKVGESPDWLKEKLAVLGQKSINNIVDATNLVMLETGQPVHAFDFDKIRGNERKEIFIRTAVDGEKIVTLDGREHELDSTMLVIADEEKPLDIAGIKGGIASGIDSDTKKVLLSVCNFNPVWIRKASRKLNLLTDASKRFEQGITTELVEVAMERLSELVRELAGGKVAYDVLDVYPRRKGQYRTGVSKEEVNKLLGVSLDDSKIEGIFRRLNFGHEKVKPVDKVLDEAKKLLGKKYKYGASISYDAPEFFDCSSFVSYLYSLAGLSVPRLTVDQYLYGMPVTESELIPGDVVFSRNDQGAMQPAFLRVKDGMTVTNEAVKQKSQEFMPGTEILGGVSHNGIYLGNGQVIHPSASWDKGEVVIENLEESLSFKSIKGYRRMCENKERYAVVIPHIRQDIKTHVDLIEEIGRVYGYENIDAKLPDMGSYSANKEFYYTEKIKDILVAEGFTEVMTYVLRNEGEVELANPFASDKSHLRDSLIPGMKDAMERGEKNKDLLGVNDIKIFEIGRVFKKEGERLYLGIGAKNDSQVAESAKKTWSVVGGKEINASSNFEDTKMQIVEWDIGEITKGLSEPESYDDLADTSGRKANYKPLSIYPYVLRDIAVWASQEVLNQDVSSLITEGAGEWLVRADLFDEYRKEDRVSYAYHLVFQSREKTLSDAEVNEAMAHVEKVLKDKGFEIR